MRSDKLQRPEAKEVILLFARKSEALLAQQQDLKTFFRAINSLERDKITEALNIFISSNILSFLSPKYRRAKRFYKSITREHKFSNEYAAQQLRGLIDWLGEMRKFSTNEKIKIYLGDYFHGLETNFRPFVKLIEFYDRINNELKGIKRAKLRTLLTKGAYSSLINLPKLDKENALRCVIEKKHNELEEKISSLESTKKLFDAAKISMVECLKYLGLRCNFSHDELLSLATRLQVFQGKWNHLSNESLIQHIFNTKTLAPMNLPSSLSLSLTLIEEIEMLKKELKKPALFSLGNNRMERIISTLNAAIECDLSAADSLNKISSLINVNLTNCYINLNHKEICKRLTEAAVDKEGLIAYSQFYAARLELCAKEYGHILDMLMKAPIGLKGLFETINAMIGCALSQEVYKEFGNILSKFNGIKLDGLRRRLASLDREILQLSRQRLRAMLKGKAKPPPGQRSGRRSELTELALLKHEATKKTRYLPARELTRRASKALLELKPCWMMSPLAVAQYIQKGDITFDLLIIDEASQMTPEDAIGAIVRSCQSMVVGDTNQLPPSSFFKKYLDILDDDEVEEGVNEESILEIANAVFRPARRLKWHYRSRHPQLIAFSNKYVYGNNLVVFPSPNTNTDIRSVSLHKINGLYSKGTNPIEASKLADAAINFMHNHKDMSLGVVVLNQRQRDLIIDEIDYRVARDTVALKYMEYWENHNDGLESFFIKNLENVQGDERDVIMIGTVYGPEKENAPVMQRFGPINGINGKRRLNVLFSRAKRKIITFSSMTANDIRADEHSNEGVALLKYWLEYCATGKALSDVSSPGKPDSVFEEYVIQQLESIGCKAVSLVGVSGYSIDIGVKHPKWPHGYIMGIECDGASYHSSKSARERDRLREEVLVKLGWHLYRIWSTDWFADPSSEAQKMRVIIEKRLQALLTQKH